MDINEEIERAIKLFREATKNTKPEKKREKIIFWNGIPYFISEHNSARQFEVEFLWLRPKALRGALGLSKLEEKPRERMYV